MGSGIYRGKIIEYFEKNLSKGYTLEALKWALINQGYSRLVVEHALEDAHRAIAKKAPILKEKPEIKHEILDEQNNPIVIKKSWWKRIFN